MEAMIVLCMLAQATDGDAMLLLVLGIPVFIIFIAMMWARESDKEFFRRVENDEEEN